MAAITEEAFDEAIAKWRIKDAIPSPVLIASAGLVGTVARLVCGVKPTKEALENIRSTEGVESRHKVSIHAYGTVHDLSCAICSDPDDLSMKSSALLPCVTHVINVRDIAQLADVRARLQLGKRNINFLANGHREKMYYKLLSEARFGSMYLVFDKTGGAAQEIAWDVYCHSSKKLEVVPPFFSTCGVTIVGSELPTDQFNVVDPLPSLTKIKKMYGEILGAVQEHDDADDDGIQWERKRIQYVWEQIAVFRHNGKAFRSLGRMLQFTVVFLAFLTSATSIADTNCEDALLIHIWKFLEKIGKTNQAHS